MTSTAVTATAALLAGGLLGVAYFALLFRSLHWQAGRPALAFGLLAGRMLLAGGVFWSLAQLGPWPLLAGLAGFLVVRVIAQRRVLAR